MSVANAKMKKIKKKGLVIVMTWWQLTIIFNKIFK